MRAIPFIMFLLIAAGCSSLSKYKDMKKPDVKIDKVNVQSAGATSATLVFALNVQNPNPFPLKVDGVDYQVDVAGRPFTSGKIEETLEVAAESASIIQLPISLKYADVLDSITDLLGNKTTPYSVRGGATIGWLRIPFDEKGELVFKNGKLEKK